MIFISRDRITSYTIYPFNVDYNEEWGQHTPLFEPNTHSELV